jgi:hypothetical protein
VVIATLLVFTRMFSSWPTSARVAFASVFAIGSFVTCLTPGDRSDWLGLIQAIDLAFYTMISGTFGIYLHSRLTHEEFPSVGNSTHLFH